MPAKKRTTPSKKTTSNLRKQLIAKMKTINSRGEKYYKEYVRELSDTLIIQNIKLQIV